MLASSRLLRTGFNLSNSNFIKDIQKCRFHIYAPPNFIPNKRRLILLKKETPLRLGIISSVRFASNETEIPEPPIPLPQEAITEQVLLENPDVSPEVLLESPRIFEAIPEPPPVIEEIVGEATLQSIGLGGWSPIGLAQRSLDFLHISCDLPWWGAIVIGTVVVRVLMFPLVIIAQRNAAKMHNNLPGLQALQLKMTDARERGDKIEAAKYGQEMILYFKERGINPLKNMLVPLAQAPVFISFFLGLRRMAQYPVESMREGGMLWFVDLTVPDQFYLLPLLTSATLALTIELGTDAARLNSANLGMMKYILRGMPIVIFPFTIGFPAGILVYWTSSNFISLLQVSFLRIPKVRDFFKIEQLKSYNKDKDLPIKDKGFMKGVSDSWTNIKITRELEERQRIDEINFMNAGRGAVKKTFKFDPTQKKPTITTLEAKKRH